MLSLYTINFGEGKVSILAKVGEAHRAAAKRRAWAKREGERLEEERRAHCTGEHTCRGEVL